MDRHYTDWDATSCFIKPITHIFLCLASMHVSRKIFMYIPVYVRDIFYKFACSSIFVNVHASTRLKSCLFFICMIDYFVHWGYNKNKSQYCTGDITFYSNFKNWKIPKKMCELFLNFIDMFCLQHIKIYNDSIKSGTTDSCV